MCILAVTDISTVFDIFVSLNTTGVSFPFSFEGGIGFSFRNIVLFSKNKSI
jgi:hypothetical protein